MLLWTLLLYIAVVACQRSIHVVRESSEDIYIESRAPDNTLGFLFDLRFGTLVVQAKAMHGNTTVQPSIFTVLPNLLLEFNGSTSVGTSKSVYTFLNFSRESRNWGNGLVLLKRSDSVYEVQSNWTHITKRELTFRTRMLMCTRPVLYQGFKLLPNEIRLVFTVLDYPYILERSTLACDQLLLTGAPLTNRTLDQAIMYSSGGVTDLFINEAALVDGVPHAVIPENIRFQNYWKDFIQDSSAANFAGKLIPSDILFSFAGSRQAKNVTFLQRISINVSSIRSQGAGELDDNASNSLSWSLGYLFLGVLFSMLLSLGLRVPWPFC